MSDGRLSVWWDIAAWVVMHVKSLGGKRRVQYLDCNPYEKQKRRRRPVVKTSDEYKRDLLEMARAYVQRSQAV